MATASQAVTMVTAVPDADSWSWGAGMMSCPVYTYDKPQAAGIARICVNASTLKDIAVGVLRPRLTMAWLCLVAFLCCSLGYIAQAQMYHRFQNFRTWQPPDYSPRPEDRYRPPPRPNQWQPPPRAPYRPPTLATTLPPTPDPSHCSPQTCQLPDCHCASLSTPNGVDKASIPQIVMFTFDDAVNEQVIDYYKQLFPAERVNPNGCPISATFFVSHNWTDYNMVKELYLMGHEIASHSITHRMPQSWWMHASYDTLKRELSGQRDNIVQKASIPKREVRGIRVPFLQIGGDTQFQMMQDEGFQYDASFMTGPHAEGGLWPYTLDFAPEVPAHCSNMNCPKKTYKGMWEVALNRWTGPSGHPCAMVDSCNTQPSGKGEVLSYLWQNFNKQYYGNKAPVGVNMHAVWFKTATYLEAMQEFIQTLVEMDDVYIVTVHQTLEWMRDPHSLDQVEDWDPWMTSCQGRSKKKLVKMVPKSEKEDPMKPDPTNKSDPMKPDMPEDEEKEERRERPGKEETRDPKRQPGKERGEKTPRGRNRGRAGMTDEQGSPYSTASPLYTGTHLAVLMLVLYWSV